MLKEYSYCTLTSYYLNCNLLTLFLWSVLSAITTFSRTNNRRSATCDIKFRGAIILIIFIWQRIVKLISSVSTWTIHMSHHSPILLVHNRIVEAVVIQVRISISVHRYRWTHNGSVIVRSVINSPGLHLLHYESIRTSISMKIEVWSCKFSFPPHF